MHDNRFFVFILLKPSHLDREMPTKNVPVNDLVSRTSMSKAERIKHRHHIFKMKHKYELSKNKK